MCTSEILANYAMQFSKIMHMCSAVLRWVALVQICNYRKSWKNHEWLSFYCFESRYFSNIHEVKAQKVCECQNTNFNKNALIFFSSNYINWILIATFAQHICENCISTFFHSNRLCHLLCILTNSIWFEVFVQILSTM